MIDKETLKDFIKDAITASEILEQAEDIISEIVVSSEGAVSHIAVRKQFLKTLKEFI